ncbi:MAG: hypothetical protein AAGD40_00645, partial [Pseudomonadota bacterium]
LNPGGNKGSSLAGSIRTARHGNNAYLDEVWSPNGRDQRRGQSVLQRRVQHLCRDMGQDTRDVPASNLAFTRSVDISTHADFDDAVRMCMPVHHIFLRAIRPVFLMTFGSIDHFRKAGFNGQYETRSAEHGGWKAYRGSTTVDGCNYLFGNVPHMSVWASDRRPAVMDWVLEEFRSRQLG